MHDRVGKGSVLGRRLASTQGRGFEPRSSTTASAVETTDTANSQGTSRSAALRLAEQGGLPDDPTIRSGRRSDRVRDCRRLRWPTVSTTPDGKAWLAAIATACDMIARHKSCAAPWPGRSRRHDDLCAMTGRHGRVELQSNASVWFVAGGANNGINLHNRGRASHSKADTLQKSGRVGRPPHNTLPPALASRQWRHRLFRLRARRCRATADPAPIAGRLFRTVRAECAHTGPARWASAARRRLRDTWTVRGCTDVEVEGHAPEQWIVDLARGATPSSSSRVRQRVRARPCDRGRTTTAARRDADPRTVVGSCAAILAQRTRWAARQRRAGRRNP